MTDDQTAGSLIACSLDGNEQITRMDAWRQLLATSEERDSTPEGVRYLFPATDDVESHVRELAAAEHRCCSFLQFSVSRLGDHVEMTVAAPSEGVDALRFIFAT